jgi:excisionase family DNA binding protein
MPSELTARGLISVKAAAELMRTTSHTVLTAAAAGHIKGVAIPGRTLVISRESVERHIEKLAAAAAN